MSIQQTLETSLSRSFSTHLEMREVLPHTYQIFLPYYHEDGDMIDLFVKSVGDTRLVTDLGKTMMRLSYYADIQSTLRRNMFDTILMSYDVQCIGGKIELAVDHIEGLYPAIMEMIAVSTKISDISYLKQEREKKIFYENFDIFVYDDIAKRYDVDIQKKYLPDVEENHDYESPYAIISTSPKILLFPVLNDDRCKDSTNTLLYYKLKNVEATSIGIFNDSTKIAPRNVGRFMDLVDKPYSNFEKNRENLVRHTGQLMGKI